jgi:hypothetical protein
MAAAPPPSYRFARLLQDLDKPVGTPGLGYECRLGEIWSQYSPPTERPYIKANNAVMLPTRELCRALSVSEGGGVNLLGNIERVAAAVRPELVFGRLGVPTRTVQGVGPIGFPVLQPGAVTGGWSAEGAQGFDRQPTVKSAESAPHVAIGFIQFSRHLLHHAEGVEDDLLAELEAATEGVIESGFIAGSGTENEPHGILLQASGAASYGAALPTYQELVAQLETYTGNHGTLRRARWMVNSAMACDLLNVEKVASTGRFAGEIDEAGNLRILGIRAEISDYMPAGKVALLDPMAIRVTYWGNPFALMNRWTDGMDLRNEAHLVVWNACDVAVKYPQLVVVGSN